MALAITVSSQNCETFFPVEKGTFTEIKNFDAKGKLTGSIQQTITNVNQQSGKLIIEAKSEQFDNKNKSLGVQELTMRCENNIFYMDMKNFFNQSSLGDTKDAEITIDATDLEFPATIKPGDVLPDGTMQVSLQAGPMPMNMSVNIYNRKVEAIENVTTPAGTFECYKIKYDIDTKTLFKMSNSAIQWYSKNVGAVRTETYNKNGKLVGYSEMTSFKK